MCAAVALPNAGAIFVVEDPPKLALPPTSQWDAGYVAQFEAAAREHGLNRTDANLLAFLYARTRDRAYGAAASAALKATASNTKPAWLSADRTWNAPLWTAFDLQNTTFTELARFSGCTDYGLVGYWVLVNSGYELDWTVEELARFKHMHQALCIVWFDGAWNQGTWSGLGNAVLQAVFPNTADEHTPWMYPFLTRAEHSAKVYRDFFDEYQMMEDADGYNQIWTSMMLVFPEVTGTTADLHHPAVTNLLTNFAAYIGPDGEVFQYT